MTCYGTSTGPCVTIPVVCNQWGVYTWSRGMQSVGCIHMIPWYAISGVYTHDPVVCNQWGVYTWSRGMQSVGCIHMIPWYAISGVYTHDPLIAYHGIMCIHPTDCIPRDHVYTPHWLHTTGSCVYTPLIAYHGIMCIHPLIASCVDTDWIPFPCTRVLDMCWWQLVLSTELRDVVSSCHPNFAEVCLWWIGRSRCPCPEWQCTEPCSIQP